MAYAPGFTYVSGPYEIRRSVASSGQSFLRGDPLELGLGNTCVIATSASSTIYGIAAQDATTSIYNASTGTQEMLVLVPNEQTVFASFCTGAAASSLSVGRSYNLKSTITTRSSSTQVAAGYVNLVVDSSSSASALVTIVQRGDGSTIDSADSSVFVQFLQSKLAPFGAVNALGVL